MRLKFSDKLRQIAYPTLAFAAFSFLSSRWGQLQDTVYLPLFNQVIATVHYTFEIGLWISLAWLVIVFVDAFFWEGLVAPQFGGRVPRLPKNMFAVLIWFGAASQIIGKVFGISLGGVWTASGVIGVVVGLAIRNLIADAFSGIAINMDQPFKVGDFVEFEGQVGWVKDINWRATRILKPDQRVLIVPNSKLAAIEIINYEAEKPTRFEFDLYFDFENSFERILKVLEDGIRAARHKNLLLRPAPKVYFIGINERGLEFRVWYFCDVTIPMGPRHTLLSSIVKHLEFAGIKPAIPKLSLRTPEPSLPEVDEDRLRLELIGKIKIFEQLELAERQALTSQFKKRFYKPDEIIVAQSEVGESMYIVLEGAVRMTMQSKTGNGEVLLGELKPGQFFGELSLLLGEPRTATIRAVKKTVLYEIEKQALMILLDHRPELIDNITQFIAKYKLFSSDIIGNLTPEKMEQMSKKIFKRIQTYFMMQRDEGAKLLNPSGIVSLFINQLLTDYEGRRGIYGTLRLRAPLDVTVRRFAGDHPHLAQLPVRNNRLDVAAIDEYFSPDKLETAELLHLLHELLQQIYEDAKSTISPKIAKSRYDAVFKNTFINEYTPEALEISDIVRINP